MSALVGGCRCVLSWPPRQVSDRPVSQVDKRELEMTECPVGEPLVSGVESPLGRGGCSTEVCPVSARGVKEQGVNRQHTCAPPVWEGRGEVIQAHGAGNSSSSQRSQAEDGGGELVLASNVLSRKRVRVANYINSGCLF